MPSAPPPPEQNPTPDLTEGRPPCLVVALGASAGGQQALEQIFTALPADCNCAYLVAMHLPPDGPSFLAGLLSRYTGMPVLTAAEGMALEANHVYVTPAGQVLELRGGRCHLGEPGVLPPGHHTIDRLFSSLADELGERCVAVVLSGSGSDGSRGIEAVRGAGGTAIVQEPTDALTPSMPAHAAGTGAAQFLLPADQIARRIAELAHDSCRLSARACSVSSLEEDLQEIFAQVKARTGHDFSSYKRSTVLRRIERRMALNDSAGMGKYLALLKESPQEAQALGQEILIGVTSFFRDPEAFEVLRSEIIPQLFAGRDPDDPVRIWHACCATGEEVYSMAMLIREYLEERQLAARVQLFATDLDEVAIAQARAGLYPDDAVSELGPSRISHFFTRAGGQWQVAKDLRQMVVFAHHNLIKDPPFSRLDLLVCRNFLIYLNPDMQKRLFSLFHLVLKPSGCLFLGSAETVGPHSDLFAPLDKKWRIYERLEHTRREEPVLPFTAVPRRLAGTPRSAQAAAPAPSSPAQLAERFLAGSYLPPHVIVNEKFEVLHVSAGAERLLSVPVGEPTRDLLKMAREELRPALRAAVYKTFHEERDIAFRGVRLVREAGEGAVNVLVHSLSGAPAERLALVVLESAPVPAAAAEGEPAAAPEDPAGRDQLVRQLEEQLRLTHEQLVATSEQLETSQEGFVSANEELMSINEEFQSANEELQSINEELETSKEELQALNEELCTTNSELQEKLEELDQAKNDMENLLASSDVATLFLDQGLIIKRFTPAMGEILNLIPADVGRPFRHLAGTIDWAGLSADAAAVMSGDTPLEREVAGVDNGRSYLMRVLPYRCSAGVGGVVVTLVDITERKQTEQAILHAKEQWERTFDSVPDLIAIMDHRHRIVRGNRALAERLGVTPAQCVGQLCYVLMHGTDRPPEHCPHSLTLRDGREHVAEVYEARLGGDFLVSTSALIDADGSMTGSVHVARDITDRKRAEAEVGDRVRELERFNEASVGRELRMIELKQEVNDLCRGLGLAARYRLEFSHDDLKLPENTGEAAP